MHSIRPLRSLLRPLRPGLHGVPSSRNRLSPFWANTHILTRHKHYRPPTNQPHQSTPQSSIGSNLDYASPEEPDAAVAQRLPIVKVNYLRPLIWALSVSGATYALLAYLEAKEESKPKPWAMPQIRLQRRESIPPQELAQMYWKNLDPISKFSQGLIATNGVIHLGSFLVPKFWGMLWHMPVLNFSPTLLTSVFVHSGAFHLFFNMWACYNFLPPTGHSRLFEGDPYHTLSFFVSAGVLSSYAQHLSTAFNNQAKSIEAGIVPAAWIRSGGASGALFGVLGVFCMQYPDAGIGIAFLPFSFAALNFLPCIMAFDLYGMVRGFPGLPLGHAAHLSGALIGVAYSYFDGKNRVWKPLVGVFKKRLEKQGRS